MAAPANSQEIVPLAALGRRIVVCGPSNSGKSSIATAISQKLQLPVVHLDVLELLPAKGERREPAAFHRLHDLAILEDAWVIDGNHSRLIPQRLLRATGIILLDDHRWANLVRYLHRTLTRKNRAGYMQGIREPFRLEMVRWILVGEPGDRRYYRGKLIASGLPLVEVHSMNELVQLHSEWGLG